MFWPEFVWWKKLHISLYFNQIIPDILEFKQMTANQREERLTITISGRKEQTNIQSYNFNCFIQLNYTPTLIDTVGLEPTSFIRNGIRSNR